MSYQKRKIIKALERRGFHQLREGSNHTIILIVKVTGFHQLREGSNHTIILIVKVKGFQSAGIPK